MSGQKPARVRKLLLKPIAQLYDWKKEGSAIEIWLYDQRDVRLQGKLLGFDQFMNLVVDDVVEVSKKKGTRRPLGKVLLKGENVTLIRPLPSLSSSSSSSSS